MRNKKNILAIVKDFVLKNLELFPLCISLQFWYDAGLDYRYWITVLLVVVCSEISTRYNISKNNLKK